MELDVDGAMVRASDQLWLMTGRTRTDDLDLLDEGGFGDVYLAEQQSPVEEAELPWTAS